MSYIVIELNCSGIPADELKAEPFTETQESILTQLDASVQEAIRRGVPCTVMDMDSGQLIASFNPKNVKPSDFEMRLLARTLFEEARKFYADPENVKAFEKWNRKQGREKGSVQP